MKKSKPIFQFILSFFLVQPLIYSNNYHCNCHCRPSQRPPGTHAASPLPPPSPLPRQLSSSLWRLKLLSSYTMLRPPTHHCYRHHHHAAAASPNVLLPWLKLCFHQAATSATKLAATTVLPPPPPLLMRGNRRANTAYKINKKGILLTNLSLKKMVTTARSDDCGATRQQRWQCCYLQLPRIVLMLQSDKHEASIHIENKNKMTEHSNTLKILMLQLLLE